MSRTLILKPRMSEKAYQQSMALNTYVFDVPFTANKQMVTRAITSQFSVSVEDVRLVIVKGKVKKSYQKRNRPVNGKRTDIKKAYVRLSAGNSINIFGEEEKASKKSDKKASKATDKKELK